MRREIERVGEEIKKEFERKAVKEIDAVKNRIIADLLSKLVFRTNDDPFTDKRIFIIEVPKDLSNDTTLDANI